MLSHLWASLAPRPDVSTLLEILEYRESADKVFAVAWMFQPFLRFWRYWSGGRFRHSEDFVSTLLEILARNKIEIEDGGRKVIIVSTLLEILAGVEGDGHVLVVKYVSTLLEILGLVWLVVVGF